MLSVVITSYDHPDITAAHVRECMRSTVVPDEIIVVNDHGAPELKEMLEKLERNTKIIYAWINEDIPWNYTGARNLGYWLSRGDFISFEDCDNIPSTGAYEAALKVMEDKPEVSRVLYGRRPKILKADFLSMPIEDCHSYGTRPIHDDTQLLRREVYMTVKGCDERFAGKYAWACADWRRRLDRAGILSSKTTVHFYSVWDGETENSDKITRRKSYENYELASERTHKSVIFQTRRRKDDSHDWVELMSKDGHTQSPVGVMNFGYSYEEL